MLQATGLVEITLPPWLMAGAYMVLGWYVGLGFDREVTRTAVRGSQASKVAPAQEEEGIVVRWVPQGFSCK